MKLEVRSLLAILVFFSCVHIVFANSQGLQWDVEVGDQFNYTLKYKEMRDAGSPDKPEIEGPIYFEITNLSSLPDIVTSFFDLYWIYIEFEAYWSNGTRLPLGLPWTALPTGNWTLMNELYNDAEKIGNVTVIDTNTIWGYTIVNPSIGITETYSFHFSKSDGVMNYYRFQTVTERNEILFYYEITREGYNPFLDEPDTTMSIIIVGIGIVAVVVIIGLIRKRKSLKMFVHDSSYSLI